MIYKANKIWHDKEIMDGFKMKRPEFPKPERLYDNSDSIYHKTIENPPPHNPSFFRWLAAGKI